MASRLSSLLDPARINLRVQPSERAAALSEVASQLNGHPDVTNFTGFLQELVAREALDTTYLGNEISLPHARTEHVNRVVLAVGRSDSGIKMENNDEDVRLMFVLGTPKSNPIDYLKVVSALCKILKEPTNLKALMTAPTPAAFVAALVTAEANLPASA